MRSPKYKKSHELFDRAIKVIPGGSQTFSKSSLSYPSGHAPLFLSHGVGSHVWDVDGNEYIDFVNGLLPNILGYDDPDVANAVIQQVKKGVSHSLATELEVELAEELVKLIPCAEMVRFGKNGSDVTSGAIRVARAYTGKNRIAVCGYHGWQDWYIGSTLRSKGVPKDVSDLTHTFEFNNIESLENLLNRYPNQFAAIIMEPMNFVEPKENFLSNVKNLAHKNGALFILDEIITGFRYDLGGAQKLFGVTPDLATFGKSMGNGFPISALVGRAEIMNEMNEIFFSFTFGGECVSLAAALSVIKKMQREPVIEVINQRGTQLVNGINFLIDKYQLKEIFSVDGRASWSYLKINGNDKYDSWKIKTLFLQEVIARGVLTAGAHNMCYRHNESDIKFTLNVYDEVFKVVHDGLLENSLNNLLLCEPLEPIFKVRS
jgi:glutamate-1-semialdehyde 2,1-aminomutase